MRREKRFRWLLWSCFCAAALAFAPPGFGQVQNGPITEPRGTSSESTTPVVKGPAAISQHRDKCFTRLVVEADALFKPHRWTLNPDAAETLDVLGPMIVKEGVGERILAHTSASDSVSENKSVSERRALTVRTWLSNHGFLSSNADIFVVAPQASQNSKSQSSRAAGQNGAVEVIVATCH